MSVTFLVYVLVIVVPFVRRAPAPPGTVAEFDWHFFVPCRDEEAVIGGTIHYLRGTFPHAHLWVIDDDSDDRTTGIVRSARRNGGTRDPYIHLVQRCRPEARTGKGHALNAGYQQLREWLDPHADPERIIVVVVDADGRPASNCLDVCAGRHLFGDPRVGAVQIDVRMINRDQRPVGLRGPRRWLGTTLVRMQDLEFRTAISAIQLSRGYTGTIAMGGNGQFTRLAALDSIAGQSSTPWRGSLLEDFELGVHLLTNGWRTGYTADTHVEQEGLYSVRRFLAQRTRWGQGTMQCARYLRQVWASPHLTTLGAIEVMYYLAQPWMQLIGTLIYPVPIMLTFWRATQDPHQVFTWFTSGAWILFVAYCAFGLLPFVIWGPIYRARCEPRISLLRSLWFGCAYAVYIYTFYITSWRAVIRLLRHRNGWAKTRRNNETTIIGAIAPDH
ncbi:glycosyltransferase [Amycolatopsis sp. H20-H5]|uniref:glycosyltransferase n=1 Tax=Amycolatopsis sp. H20-H5 TaxID=3046309 RepID=UPI002DB9D2E9|nr:glycosyltransferase [Amycolatopsis sp. H20-H5]MEC3982523.1 glycosyltransferase [Amycolatopsis sp. H20-H5]